MEECKRMGLKVLGPDVNESKQGFAVNSKAEIRVGLGGLKGVGEAAVFSLIEEREKNGPYISIFDMVKRINQRTVSKKTLESLAFAGAFDCFPQLHRAQYFFVTPGETINGLEKIIRFGNIAQAQNVSHGNTLFGVSSSEYEVQPPKIANCEQWSLTELLDHEKEVTGMFLSGHPLDHFKFEIIHYGILNLAEFNEIKDAVSLQANPGKSYRLAGLVVEAQHRVTKTGKQFGSFTIEDYSGKSEFVLWSEDYARYSNYLEAGKNIFMTGFFKPRYNRPEFEFKVDKMLLLESIKPLLTKQLIIDLDARHLNESMVGFLEKNIKKHPGKATLKFNVQESKTNAKISLYSLESGFEMNDEMAAFLQDCPEFEVQVVSY
jgi:DNA polymerase-3 subunit alpha